MDEGPDSSSPAHIKGEAMFWQYALERSPNADWLIERDEFRAKLMPMIAKWFVSIGIKHADPHWNKLFGVDFHGSSKGNGRRTPGFKEKISKKESEIDQLVNDASRWSVALSGADNRELREAIFEVREALIEAKAAVAKAVESVNLMSKLLPDQDRNPNSYSDRLGMDFEAIAGYVVWSWCEGGRHFPKENKDDGGLLSLLSCIHFFATGDEIPSRNPSIWALRDWRNKLYKGRPFGSKR